MLRARVERWWPDLLGGLTAVYGAERAPVLGADLVELAAAAFSVRSDRLHLRDLRADAAPRLAAGPGCLGYAAYTERFAGDLRGVAEHLTYLDELGVTYLHLMPLLQPRDGRQRRRLRRRRTTARCAPTSAPWTTSRDLRGAAARAAASASCSTSCSTTSPASTSGRGGPGPASRRYRDYFHVFPDRDDARRLRAHPARGLPRLRARATSPGTTTSTAGSGRRSTSASGTSTGPTPRCCASSPTIILVAGQPRRRGAAARRDRLHVEAAGHRLPEPARGARASPRRCAR